MPSKKRDAKKAGSNSLTLRRIINAADRAYPDGIVGLYHKEPNGEHGDSLARLIASELGEAFDGSAERNAQVEAALRVLTNIRHQIEDCEDEISKLAK